MVWVLVVESAAAATREKKKARARRISMAHGIALQAASAETAAAYELLAQQAKQLTSTS